MEIEAIPRGREGAEGGKNFGLYHTCKKNEVA